MAEASRDCGVTFELRERRSRYSVGKYDVAQVGCLWERYEMGALMKTEMLLNALVNDAEVGLKLERSVSVAFLSGAIIAGALFFWRSVSVLTSATLWKRSAFSSSLR